MCVQRPESVNIAGRTVSVQAPTGLSAFSYDLLVGADGYDSTVRRAFVKVVKYMQSTASFVGPMRYVAVSGLSPDAEWRDDKAAKVVSPPLDNFKSEPAVASSGALTLQRSHTVSVRVGVMDAAG